MDIGLTLTAFGAMLAGFYAIARLMLNQATADRSADRRERKEFQKAILKMAKSSDRVADATERSADEAKQRNGHLAELITTSSDQVKVIADSAQKNIIAAIKVQTVKEQHVEHQQVDKADIKDAS